MLQKVFGANVDWISQHSVFPEYFRQQFYETGALFPEFAANIGGGQNIYHFAYYGLYNPLLLPAYFLPFIKMSDYLMGISILCLLADGILFYKWMKNNQISKGNALLATILFLLAGPMIFHSYNQIMFVNYMPFLLLGLIGVDRFFQEEKRGLLITGVFLMILTSFYFSIGGLLVLSVYGSYCSWKIQEEKKGVTIRQFFKDGVSFGGLLMTGILSTGFLLVPTAMALLCGERKGGALQSISSLLIPDLEVFRFVYQPYGIGLTTCVITVLLTGVAYKKWSEKYLHMACILILVVPAFSYLLNGGLYIRDKALIPLLPLLCYLTAMYLKKYRHRELSFWVGILPLCITLLFVLFGRVQKEGSAYRWLIAADAVVMLLSGLFYYWKKGSEKRFILFPILFLFLFGMGYHGKMNRMLDTSFYKQVTDTEYENTVKQLLKKEKGFYRLEQQGTGEENAANLNRIWSARQYSSSLYSSTYNAEYQRFRTKVFDVEQPYRNVLMQAQAENAIFQRLMGVKYILSSGAVPGYQESSAGIYKNEDVFPIIYGTDQVIAQTEFETYAFPYNQLTFLSHAVVPRTLSDTLEEKKEIQTVDLAAKIHAGDKKIILDERQEGDIFLLQFDVKNHQNSDVWVSIDGVKNKLTAQNHIYYNENETFTFAFALEEGQREIPIAFSEGKYEISNVKCYLYQMQQSTLVQSEFQVNQQETKGNQIVGEINMEKDGYLITSIPYEDSFTVKIDGEERNYEKVNTAFLGLQLEKGTHHVEIVYHAPGSAAGKVVTGIGVSLWCILIAIQFRKKKKTLFANHCV